jgi:morphogenetic protein associated with SpoVID
MRGVWFDLKIHIVRKGDTLWEIAKQYGVDFEQLKQFNPQLSSPDMIMPGMKIKIPSSVKPVKKESVAVKETKEQKQKEMPKQSLVIEEDDHEKPKEVKIEMPKKHAPEKSPKPLTPIKEVPIVKELPKVPMKPMKEMIKMPVMEEPPAKLPKTSPPKKPKKQKEEKVSHQVPVAPICYHYYHHCCPPTYHHCFPVMGEMAGGFMPHHHMHHGHMMQEHHMQMHENLMYHQPMPMPLQQQQMMQSHDCGCQAAGPPFSPYQMREQIPVPFLEPIGHQPYMVESQRQQTYPELPPFQPNLNHEFTQSIEKSFPMPPQYPANSELNHRKNKEEQRTDDEQSKNE